MKRYSLQRMFILDNLLLPDQVEEGTTRSYVSLTDLTSYVQKLRSFLPKATVTLRRDHHGTGLEEGEGPEVMEDDNDEDYVSYFLSQALVADWNKLGSKVCSLNVK